MSGKILIEKLNPHPKNTYYFTDIEGEKYEEVKRSIEVNGIRDSLKVTTNYTIVSGHQRFRIAKELNLVEVPVEIVDVDEWKAEYLLIAENVERRGQAEIDPIKKARIAQFLKEYWGIRSGGNGSNQFKQLGQNGQVARTTSDIAETIGESSKQVQRLLKLNDLIPEIQSFVSKGKLGTTAATELAYLSKEVQEELIFKMGESLSEISVVESKKLREENEKLKNQPPKVETRVVEKEVVVDNTDYDSITKLNNQIHNMSEKLESIERQKELLQQRLKQEEKDADDYRKLKKELDDLHSKKDDIHRQIESATSISGLVVEIEHMLQNKLAPIKYSRALSEQRDSDVVIDNLNEIVDRVYSWCDEMKNLIPKKDINIIDAEVIEYE